MRLEDLYTDFSALDAAKQLEFVAAYRLRRATDLETVPIKTIARSAPARAKTKVVLSSEEKALLKMLGIKQKDIAVLKAAAVEDKEDEETASALFKDDTYEEED